VRAVSIRKIDIAEAGVELSIFFCSFFSGLSTEFISGSFIAGGSWKRRGRWVAADRTHLVL
jgi:hypothetical protein